MPHICLGPLTPPTSGLILIDALYLSYLFSLGQKLLTIHDISTNPHNLLMGYVKNIIKTHMYCDSLLIMLTKPAQLVISKACIVKENKTLSKFQISMLRKSKGNICYAGLVLTLHEQHNLKAQYRPLSFACLCCCFGFTEARRPLLLKSSIAGFHMTSLNFKLQNY